MMLKEKENSQEGKGRRKDEKPRHQMAKKRGYRLREVERSIQDQGMILRPSKISRTNYEKKSGSKKGGTERPELDRL